MSEVKKLIDKISKLANEYSRLKVKFDSAVVREYGFHYSDRDLDEIIDCLDYGHGGMSFNEFDEIMKASKP